MSANHATTLTDANFRSQVLESDLPVLVDFWAPWCPPCRMLGPTIDDLAKAYGSRATIGKLNVDENPQVASAFGISSIPAVLIFKGGRVVEQFVGVQPRTRYEQALSRAEAA